MSVKFALSTRKNRQLLPALCVSVTMCSRSVAAECVEVNERTSNGAAGTSSRLGIRVNRAERHRSDSC